jgi:LysR family transcriptional regulator, cyn operon transcriptional activator
VEIRQLQSLLAVIDNGGVTVAARKLGLSPGAVTLQLQALAGQLRTELFVRQGKRLKATPAALRLAEHARTALLRLREIEAEFASDADHETRPLHFATGAATLIHRLGRPLRLLRKRFPHAQIHVTVSTTEEMVAGLLDRRFDLALISLPYPEHDLRIVPLFDEELLIMRPTSEPVRGWHVGTIDPSELQSARFVLNPRRSNMRTIIDEFFRQTGISPEVFMEADETETMRGLIECGFGWSILPESALHGQPRFFHVYRVPEHRIVRKQGSQCHGRATRVR